MTAATIDIPFGRLGAEQPTPSEQEQFNRFTNWFSRSRKTLHFIASLILGGSEMADDAVERCWIRASRNPPSFENEGAFRSWLMRQLIGEALSILHQSHTKASEENLSEFSQEERPRLRTGEHDHDTNPECFVYELEPW